MSPPAKFPDASRLGAAYFAYARIIEGPTTKRHPEQTKQERRAGRVHIRLQVPVLHRDELAAHLLAGADYCRVGLSRLHGPDHREGHPSSFLLDFRPVRSL